MAFHQYSQLFVSVFVLGILSTSLACKFSDISDCIEEISDLEFEDIDDVCTGVTTAKTCLQTLSDSGRCNAEIQAAIDTNMGTIEKMEDACEKAAGNEIVRCTTNAIFECAEPSQSAKATGNKEMLCKAWEFTKPCLEAIADKCEKKKMIVRAVKMATKALSAVAVVC